jgi:hypothetical protein
MEIADNEAFLNTNVIDNLVDLNTRLEAAGGVKVVYAGTWAPNASYTIMVSPTQGTASSFPGTWTNWIQDGATQANDVITFATTGIYEITVRARVAQNSGSVINNAMLAFKDQNGANQYDSVYLPPVQSTMTDPQGFTLSGVYRFTSTASCGLDIHGGGGSMLWRSGSPAALRIVVSKLGDI